MARTQAQRREETAARLLDASIATIIDVGYARASAAALGRRGAELCGQYVTGPHRFDIVDGSHWIPDEQPELIADLVVDRIHGH